MRLNVRRHLGMFAVAVTSALALLATTAAAALATVPGGLIDGQGQNIGRGGVFTVTTLSGWSTAGVIGGLAISAAAVALVAWFGIRSDNRASRKLALAPSASSALASESTADQERKAA